ncbi:MAG: acetyl-CoA C-acyltransferase family protein [Arenicellales bacterium]|nr:acetyl-CoA C-acyltransferase family protein [Arenicellales bacterium]
MSDRQVVVMSAVRTAIGGYGGALKDFPANRLAALVTQEAINRSGISPERFGHCVFGNVAHSEPRDMYLARCAALEGGLPKEVPAFTLNRLCGSGLQAVVSAAQTILLGDCDIALAGGAESMTRVPYHLPAMRWGARMGDTVAVDAMVAALNDPFNSYHMGVTAENIAEKWEIGRQTQDELALESHRRATNAINSGYFSEQIYPIEIKSKKQTIIFDKDEHVREDISMDQLGKLRTVFKNDGSVTAGNASGINDAAAAVVLADAKVAEESDLKPMGRLIAYAHAGVEPEYMGIGPVPAVKAVLSKANLTIDDIDIFELNEAFAAQALAVIRDLNLPLDKTNPNGSGISLGHPIGATGCILTVKALYELQRTGGRYACVTMCIGGGQGIAAIFEKM